MSKKRIAELEVEVSELKRAIQESKAAETKAMLEKAAADKNVETLTIAFATKQYWDKCNDVHRQFLAHKAEIWFKEFRPDAIEATCREVASGLRGITTDHVDAAVIDHVSRTIRGIENIGAIVRVKGRESLFRDAADTLKFIYVTLQRDRSPLLLTHGAIADGGWIEIGLGIFPDGKDSTADGQTETTNIASALTESEERVIKEMRQKYNIELRPW